MNYRMKLVQGSILCLVLSGCFDYGYNVEPYPHREAIIISKEELRQSVKSTAPRTLKNPGKIYKLGRYIFVNEKFEGVHVIDNQDPRSPQIVSFIAAPGCIDMATKSHYLYLDNAVDLVAVDVSDPVNIKVSKRIPDIFPHLTDTESWSTTTPTYDKKTHVIIGWKETSR